MKTVSRLVFALAIMSTFAGHAGADEPAVESYVEAMVGAVRLIALPCTPPFETLAPDEKVVCLGPYWSFREFRAIWDQTATDPNFVPVVPGVLSGWVSKGGVHERRYAVAGYTVRVVFENKTDKSAIFYETAPSAAASEASAPSAAALAAAAAAAAELPAEAPGGDFESPPPAAAGPAVAGVAAAAAATPTGATPATGVETTVTRTEPPPAETPPASAETAPAGSETAATLAATAPAPAQAPKESTFVPPAVIPASRVEPTYPLKARIARMSGRVVLDVVVHGDGRLGEVTVLSCDKPGYGFEDAAIRAVRRWRFTAALRDGRPVDASTAVVLNFTPGG